MGLGCVTCRQDWDVLPVDGTGMCYLWLGLGCVTCRWDLDVLPVDGTGMCYL